MSILNAIVTEGPLKGFPLCAALAIESGQATPSEAKRRVIEGYRSEADRAAARYQAAIIHVESLPDTITFGGE